ncbi:MAG: thioredoxin-like domain-containing protein [Bacteroidales bacterium]
MIEPGEKITFKAQADSLNFPFELAGSPGTQLILDYNYRLQETLAQLGELNQVYSDNIDSPDLESIMNDLDNRAREILKQMNEYTKGYIDDNLSSLVTLMALYQQVVPQVYVLNPEEDIDYFVKVDSALFSMYPDYEPVAALHEQIATLVSSMGGEIMGGSTTGMGAFAPEITLPGTDGIEKVSLQPGGALFFLISGQHGVHPAGWKNPNLVKAYEKYHSQGFDIFQVSLDKDHESWIKGIEEDNLGKWHHVSDLKYWESSVVPLYGIESIPANYLLDEDGRIIASNLRGDALNAKLEELFNK